MSTLTVDGKFPRHLKVEPLSDAAFRLHVHALAHCADQETDGFVADRVLDGLTRHRDKAKLVKELMSATSRPGGPPLWVQADGGWFINDFLDYNESHDQLEAKREAARARMRGKRSPHVRANTSRTTDEHTEYEPGTIAERLPNVTGSSGEVPAIARPRAGGHGLSLFSSESDPSEADPESDPEPTSQRARTKRKSGLPEGWAPTEADIAFAASRGWSEARVAEEAEHFASYHTAQHTLSASWAASWRTWVIQGKKFERPSGVQRSTGPSRASQPAEQTFIPAKVYE